MTCLQRSPSRAKRMPSPCPRAQPSIPPCAGAGPVRISLPRSRPIVCLALIAGNPVDYVPEVTCVTRPFLLTACSREDDTRGHGMTPVDTEQHALRDPVRSASNLRIRWPRGRGSSSLPSRTAVTSGDAYGRPCAVRTLRCLAHRSLTRSRSGPRPCSSRPQGPDRAPRSLRSAASAPRATRLPQLGGRPCW